MGRLLKKTKNEIGIAPDEFIFRGQNSLTDVMLRIVDFDSESLTEDSVHSISDVKEYIDKKSVTWLNVDGLHNSQIMEDIAATFKFDRLILADVLNTQARSTIKEHDNCLYVSVKMLQQNSADKSLFVENISFIVTETFLISFQEMNGDVFDPVRQRIRKQKKRIRSGGTDYLLFALLDIVVDNYIYAISSLGDQIESLEENLLLDPKDEIIKDINKYKRELNFLRRNIKPAKEMISALVKMDSELIRESTEIHLNELWDNIKQASDSSDSYRDILSDQLNIYHTTISSRLNDIMKFLTVFSVVFIPLTFIAGIYGTNFDNVPELHYQYSYFIMWGVFIAIAIGMMVYFKVKKWF